MLISEITEAIVFLREHNQTIPSETIEFIKQAAMDKANGIADSNQRGIDIKYIKENLGYHGAIGEGFMADELLVYSMFNDETRQLITEIDSEGVSVTRYFQEVEGETERYYYSELGTPMLAEISKKVEDWVADQIQTKKRIED